MSITNKILDIRSDKMKRLIIAVDFDGTITKHNEFPNIGELDKRVINDLLLIQKDHDLILWTCREGEDLRNALDIILPLGLEFISVNDDHPSSIEKGWNEGKKIYADYYIDDKSVVNKDQIYQLLDHIISL